MASGQSLAPDEIHSRTVPYIPPSEVTLRADVRVVEVPVVVRDEYLHAVPGLTRNDFEVYDEGKKQPITAFSTLTFKPKDESLTPHAAADGLQVATATRFVALCFDDLHLLPAFLKPVKDAAKTFVRTSLAPGDQVAVVRTSRSENVKFTKDVGTLLEQIGNVGSSITAVNDDTQRCPAHFEPYEAYRITEHMDPGGQVLGAKMAECRACYHDCPEGLVTSAAKMVWDHVRSSTRGTLGVIASLVDGMASLPGQRMILLTSGGFLTGTFEKDVAQLMEKARHAEVVIDGLDARGLYLNASAGMAYDGMGVLASGTGGTFFHNNNDMVLGLRTLGQVPETSYVLAFAGVADARFHSLKVKLIGKSPYSVEARLGYMAPAENAAVTNPTVSKLDSEVMARDPMTDLPATFTWEQWDGPPSITMIVHLDLGRLHFKPNQDRQSQRLTIIAVLRDHGGGFVAGKRTVLDLNFKKATFEHFATTGFTTALTIKVPPGSYVARPVTHDAVEGKVAAATGNVQVK